jgi:KaiC domain protein
LIRHAGTIGSYEAVRSRRSSVSDDPAGTLPDDRTIADRPAERDRNTAGSGRNERSGGTDGDDGTDGDAGTDTDDGNDDSDRTFGSDGGDGDGEDGTDGENGSEEAGDWGEGGDGGDRDGSEELFEEDFASAFGGGGGEEGSDGVVGGDSSSGFDAEADFESAIPRVDLGIDGLDEMIHGGVPERSLIAVIGGAGTGKTTVGLQFLQQALRNDEKAIFIALEESREAVFDTASEKNWEFERYSRDGRLAVVDMDPIEMATSLRGIRSDLPRLISEFGASRVVLDSVSLLETMYDDPAKRRTETFAFAQSLKQAGVTTLLTSEAAEDVAYASRYGIVEYLTDAVFVLRYVRPSDFQETRLAVEIQKIRNANHSRETKPYEITDTGIDVYRQANFF